MLPPLLGVDAAKIINLFGSQGLLPKNIGILVAPFMASRQRQGRLCRYRWRDDGVCEVVMALSLYAGMIGAMVFLRKTEAFRKNAYLCAKLKWIINS